MDKIRKGDLPENIDPLEKKDPLEKRYSLENEDRKKSFGRRFFSFSFCIGKSV